MSIASVLSGRSVRFGNFLSSLPASDAAYRRQIEAAERAYVVGRADVARVQERDYWQTMGICRTRVDALDSGPEA